ncbi:hypothetical protein MAJ_07454, partial [Metarhizium majus ARSEF 297]
MSPYRTSSFLWHYLIFVLAIGQVLAAKPKASKNASPRIPPDEDSLHVQLDYDLYKSQPQTIIFSSHLRFRDEPKISDRQLRDLGIEAYHEMEKMAAKYNFGNRQRPYIMATLAAGNDIIFASSIKGQSSIGQGDQVSKDLEACQGISVNGHKNFGVCGEVMAFDKYYKSRVGLQKLDKNARILPIGRKLNAGGAFEYSIFTPCGTTEDDGTEDAIWGCNRFLKDITVVNEDNVSQDPDMTKFDWKKLRENGKLKFVQLPAICNEVTETTNPSPSEEGKDQKENSSNTAEKEGEVNVASRGPVFGVDATASWKVFDSLLDVKGSTPVGISDAEMNTAINELLSIYEAFPEPPTVAAGRAAVAADEQAMWASLEAYGPADSMTEAEAQQALDEIMEEYPALEAGGIEASAIGDADLMALLDTLPVVLETEFLAADVEVGAAIEAGAQALGDEDIIALMDAAPEIPEFELAFAEAAEVVEGASLLESLIELLVELPK